MAYTHQLRHRNLHKVHGDLGNLMARDPQKSDTSKNSNTKSDASSNSNTDSAINPVSSLVSVVFVTASPTFTGDVAGYTTLTPSAAAESSPQQSVTYAVTQPSIVEASSSQYIWTPASSSAAPVKETTSQASASTSREAATTYVPSATSSAVMLVASSSSAHPSSTLPTSIAVAVSSSTLLSSYVSSSQTAARSISTMTPSSTATAAASLSGGMSSGGKAGLAIGIILIIALIAGGALWFFWKKKDSDEWHKADDEKVEFGGAAAALAMKRQSRKSFLARSEKHDSNAPRLSLRPVTQFIPDLAGAKKRLSQGNPLNKMNKPVGMAAEGAGRNLTRDNPNTSQWERRAGGDGAANPFQDPVNPFGDQAKSSPPPPNVTVTPPMSDDGSSVNPMTGVTGGAAAGVAGTAILAAAAARNGHGPPKNGPGGPEGAPVAAGGPPGNVHRVQLDFKPSMDDELELSAGQLVRLLHEYDDGWVCWHQFPKSRASANMLTRLSAFVLIDLNKVSLLEPVFQHVLSDHVLPMVPLDWVQMAVR